MVKIVGLYLNLNRSTRNVVNVGIIVYVSGRKESGVDNHGTTYSGRLKFSFRFSALAPIIYGIEFGPSHETSRFFRLERNQHGVSMFGV